MNSLWGFIKKEILQTLRDPRMAILLFGVPVIQLMVFGFAISNEVKNIKIGFMQNPTDYKVRELERRAEASGWFIPQKLKPSTEEAYESLASGKIEALFIPDSKDLGYTMGREVGKAQLLLDATDLLRARSAERFLLSIAQDLNSPSDLKSSAIDVKILYNPSLSSAYQMVPGVVCMIVCIFTIILTSMSITKERERGTLEMLLVSPVKRYQIIAGKSVPYFLIGLINIFIIISAGMVIFDVPFRGPVVLYFISAIFFLIATVGVGLLISTLAQTQQQAMMGGFIFLFPAMLLSGIMTPVSNMPEYLQILASLNPLTHFVTLSRNILLKGGSPEVVLKYVAILALMAVMIFSFAIYRFKKTL